MADEQGNEYLKDRFERARETLCDAAAAELLMPELVFRKYLSTFGISIGSVELLANAFKVSLQSAARRMAEVSVKPCVVKVFMLPVQAIGCDSVRA